MDENSMEQTQLLRNIWNEMKQLGDNLGGRIDQTNARLDQTNARLDETNTRLGRVENRLGRVEDRLEHIDGSVRDLADQQLILTRVVKNVVDRQDEAIEDLRERVSRLESKRSDDE